MDEPIDRSGLLRKWSRSTLLKFGSSPLTITREIYETIVNVILGANELPICRAVGIWLVGRLFESNSPWLLDVLKIKEEFLHAALSVLHLAKSHKSHNKHRKWTPKTLLDTNVLTICHNTSILIAMIHEYSLSTDFEATRRIHARQFCFMAMILMKEPINKNNYSSRDKTKSGEILSQNNSYEGNKGGPSCGPKSSNANEIVYIEWMKARLKRHCHDTINVKSIKEKDRHISQNISTLEIGDTNDAPGEVFIYNKAHKSEVRTTYKSIHNQEMPHKIKVPLHSQVDTEDEDTRFILRGKNKEMNKIIEYPTWNKHTVEKGSLHFGRNIKRQNTAEIYSVRISEEIYPINRLPPLTVLYRRSQRHDMVTQIFENGIKSLNFILEKHLKTNYMNKWILEKNMQSKVEKDIFLRQESGVRTIKAILVDIAFQRCRKALFYWKIGAIVNAEKEKCQAILCIQRSLLRWACLCRFFRLHLGQTSEGSLADIYLEESRPNVQFFVHPIVRMERRMQWYSTIAIQAEWRRYKANQNYLLLHKVIVRIQSYHRKKIQVIRYKSIVKSAIHLQAYFRHLLARKFLSRCVNSSNILRKTILGFIHRSYFSRCMKYLPILQHAMRLFKAKIDVQKIKQSNLNEFQAALTIQRAWYKKNGQFSTFVLLGCLRESDRLEEEFYSMINARYRRFSARRIQRVFLDYMRKKTTLSAIIIQCAQRRHIAILLKREKAKLKNAAILIQRRWITFWKLILSSQRKIMRCWIKSSDRRFINHIMIVAKRVVEIRRLKKLKKAVANSVIIQARIRGHREKMKYHTLRYNAKFCNLMLKYHQHHSKERKEKTKVFVISVLLIKLTFTSCVDNLISRNNLLLFHTKNEATSFIEDIFAQTNMKTSKLLQIKRKICCRKIQKQVREKYIRGQIEMKQLKKSILMNNSSKVIQKICRGFTYRSAKIKRDGAMQIQRFGRGLLGRNKVKKMRENEAIQQLFSQYLSEMTDNHVLKTWNALREKEQLDYERMQLAQFLEEKRLSIDFYLLHILRYGWTSQWVLHGYDEEGNPNTAKKLMYINSVEDVDGLYPQLERPLYTYEEYQNVIIIQCAYRVSAAKKIVFEKKKTNNKNKKLKKLLPSWKRLNDNRVRILVHFLQKYSINKEHSLHESVPIKLGWNEILRSKGICQGAYIDRREAVTAASQILYSFEEEIACISIQSSWRAKLGRKRFMIYLKKQNIQKMILQCIRNAGRLSWIGYGVYEGMSLQIWLGRLGLGEYYKSMLNKKYCNIQGQFANNNTQMTLSSNVELSHFPMESCNSLPSFLEQATDEAWLASVGIKDEYDQHLILTAKKSCETRTLFPNFDFINYFKDANDPRLVYQCIAQSRAKLFRKFEQKYPNETKLNELLAESLSKSQYPITHLQLSSFLRKNSTAKRAIDDMKSILDIKTINADSEERDAYKIYENAVLRFICIFRHFKLPSLVDQLKATLQKAESTFDISLSSRRIKSLQSIKGNRQKGVYAKAALILRCHAIDRVNIWIEKILTLQRYLRGYCWKQLFKRLMKSRRKCATLVQTIFRRHCARGMASFLREQQRSPWEQLWSVGSQAFFWINRETQSCSWNVPNNVAYRPMIKHSGTKKLIQAWPFLNSNNNNMISYDPNALPRCVICKVKAATRKCEDCLDGIGLMYCFTCFVDFHYKQIELRSHRFSIIHQKPPSRPLKCCQCEALATRKCHGISIDESLFSFISKQKIYSNNNMNNITKKKKKGKNLKPTNVIPSIDELDDLLRNDFRAPISVEMVRKFYHDYYSLNMRHRLNPIENQLQKTNNLLTQGEHDCCFWSTLERFLRLLMKQSCNDTYCDSCWEASHSSGFRSKHIWTGFHPGYVTTCSECTDSPSTIHCKTCQDSFCSQCFQNLHSNPHRQSTHDWSSLIKEPTTRPPDMTISMKKIMKKRDHSHPEWDDDDIQIEAKIEFEKWKQQYEEEQEKKGTSRSSKTIFFQNRILRDTIHHTKKVATRILNKNSKVKR